MNLNQVTLPVSNMVEATAFYIKLGFVQIVDTAHYARFECLNAGSSFSLQFEPKAFSNGAVIYFESDRLDEWVNALQTAGIIFDQLPEDKPYLWREACLKDPSGNRIKLYWAGNNRLNPPWRVNT